MLLSAQFQGFCRDLHTECARFLSRQLMPAGFEPILYQNLVFNRKLDRGNPNPGNIGADFNRLGLNFWQAVEQRDVRNRQRKQLLENVAEWRNAIAHQDFDPARLGGTIILRLARVRNWRSACQILAQSFDEVMDAHCRRLSGNAPW